MTPLPVLYLTDNPTQNGTVRILRSWLTIGRRRGLPNYVVVRPGSQLASWLEANEIPHTTNSLPVPDARRPIRGLWNAAKLAAWVKSRGISILHCNEHNSYLFATLVRRLVGLPLVCHVRYRLTREFCEWAFGRPDRRPDALLWTSRQQRSDCEEAVRGLVPEEDQHLVSIGVGLEWGDRSSEREAVRRDWGVGDDEIVIGQACVIQPRKRLEDFIQLVTRLARENRRVVGILAGRVLPGEDAYRDEVVRRIEASGLGGRLRWIGRLDDVEPFYHGIDILVSTSEYETFGNSVCEAMACRRPVVAYRGGSVKEVVDDAGLIVENGDVDALTEAARACVSRPDLREELGHRGRRRVAETYNPEKSLDQLRQLYESLAAGERGPPVKAATECHPPIDRGTPMPPAVRPPLHERCKAWGWLRARLRKLYFGIVGRTFSLDDGRRIACEAATSLRVRHPRALLRGVPTTSPYPELGAPGRAMRPSDRSDVVIITGRFRSGSTLLWNLFRQAGEFTPYYEPLNERRWFDPAVRGDRMDSTHRNVSDYWREYDGLEVLGQYYDEAWIRRDLLMDADSWAPDLKQYVDILIERAPARPVLQFNRVDFRLPWFRRHYPRARYVHIYRHPRDQWISTLMEDVGRVPPDASMADFPPFDKFYLRMWAEDLKYHFPFLDERRIEHPYRLYYLIWKLSYLFARKYCDRSVQFERLVREPDAEIRELFLAIGVASVDLESVKKVLIVPPLGRWRAYADERWFQAHEAWSDGVIAEFLASPKRPPLLAARPGQAECVADRRGGR